MRRWQQFSRVPVRCLCDLHAMCQCRKVAKMTLTAPHVFDSAVFLASAGLGRRVVRLEPTEFFFSQGDPADSVFYLQKGRAKFTVVSTIGKEATIALLTPHAFVGEEALAAMSGLRLARSEERRVGKE